jgi:hypothetical protein
MRTSYKILLLVAAVSPFAFVALLFGLFLHIINSAPVQGFEEYILSYASMLNLGSSVFTFFFVGILVIYIVHAARNLHLEANGMRTTWLIAICVLGPWVMPFYWFHYIWRDGASRSTKSGPLGLN